MMEDIYSCGTQMMVSREDSPGHYVTEMWAFPHDMPLTRRNVGIYYVHGMAFALFQSVRTGLWPESTFTAQPVSDYAFEGPEREDSANDPRSILLAFLAAGIVKVKPPPTRKMCERVARCVEARRAIQNTDLTDDERIEAMQEAAKPGMTYPYIDHFHLGSTLGNTVKHISRWVTRPGGPKGPGRYHRETEATPLQEALYKRRES